MNVRINFRALASRLRPSGFRPGPSSKPKPRRVIDGQFLAFGLIYLDEHTGEQTDRQMQVRTLDGTDAIVAFSSREKAYYYRAEQGLRDRANIRGFVPAGLEPRPSIMFLDLEFVELTNAGAPSVEA